MVSALLATIIPTFGVVGMGWFCRKIGIWGKASVGVLNNYAYYIALPALIFQAVFDLDLVRNATVADLRYLVGIIVGHLVVVILALPLMTKRFSREVRATTPMLLAFGSTAYLGIPFATYAFGETGTAYAAIGSVVLVIVFLFISLAGLNQAAHRLRRTSTWHQLFELPFLWVVLIGLALPLTGITELPVFLARTIDIFAGSAGPTALLALGAFDYDLRLSSIPWGRATLFGIGKVVLPTIATYGILVLLNVSGIPLAVGTALAATSVAVTAFVLADEYDVGKTLVAGSLATSTIASLVALTVITSLWLGTRLFLPS